MEISEFLDLMGRLPTGIRDGDALLMIKAMIWTEALEALTIEIQEAETALSTLQTELLTHGREKKKTMKLLLELSSAVQEGTKDAEKNLDLKKMELDDLNELIDGLEYERDLFPERIRRLEERFVQVLIEEIYFKLNADIEKQKVTVTEIDALRQIIKEKWTLKFDLDAQILSLNTFISSVLSIDQIDRLDDLYLKGGSND